jgi:hypothetical protein
MTESHTHAFTAAGLGAAPFNFIGVHESLFKMPGGHSKPGGTCAYCAHGIRYVFQIRSSDGIVSGVGSDCIRKVGDQGLIDNVKAERSKRDREARATKRSTAWQASLQKQRDLNGGLTDVELNERRAIERRNAEWLIRRPIAARLAPLADAIDDGRQGGFCASIAADMRRGHVPTGRAAGLVAEIIGKQAGRRGSNAYTAEFHRVKEIIDRAEMEFTR